MEFPVGGEGVRTVVWLAELPPLTVWLGPVAGESPVVGALLAGASPDTVGVTEVLGSTDGVDVVAGAVVGVVEVTELLLGLVPSLSLLQPDITATATAADERASAVVRNGRYEFFTARLCPGTSLDKLSPPRRHHYVSVTAVR